MQVEFYRNRKEENTVDGRKVITWKTGLDVDNKVQSVDERFRTGINIFLPIYLGEDPHFEEGAVSCQVLLKSYKWIDINSFLH